MGELTTTLEQAFDVTTEEGSPDFEPLPKGQYVASITDAKVGPLKSGKGQAVSLTWEVEGDKYAGRLIFDRVIIAHESAAAMKFGRQKFKDIASACGVTEQITDLSVLLNKPCLVSIKIETDDNGDYAPKNRIGRVKKIGDKPKVNGGDTKSELNDEIPFRPKRGPGASCDVPDGARVCTTKMRRSWPGWDISRSRLRQQM